MLSQSTRYRMLRGTVWHPDAIPPDEWKYRTLLRLWLPAYDAMAIFAGIWAVSFGSPILNRLFDNATLVNALGTLLIAAAVACLCGVIFPVLYRLEVAAKIILTSMLAGYGAAILLMTSPPDWFPAYVILMTLPLPFYRLSLLGEEIKERRSVRAARGD
jgi:hypothetical protein